MLMHFAPRVLSLLVPPFGCCYRFDNKADLRPWIRKVKTGGMLVDLCS